MEMKKTASVIFGAALGMAPLGIAQTPPPSPPAPQQVEQLTRKLAEQVDVIHSQMAGAAGPNTFTYVSGQLFVGSPVKGQPYSAEAVNETTQVLADGNKIVNRTSTMRFRDAEGRERREESMGKIGGFTSA